MNRIVIRPRIQIDSRAGIPLYGPVFRLEVGDGALPVLALGTYSEQDAQAKVDQLRSLTLTA